MTENLNEKSNKKIKVLLTGGGTGGHIYPALSIAEEIKEHYPNSEFLYVGGVGRLEESLTEKYGYPFSGVNVAPLPRKITLDIFKSFNKNMQGLKASKKIIKEFKPDIAIGTGGYVCGVVMLAATKEKVATLLHEQNAVMGLTNKLLANKVDKICITFNEVKATMPKKSVAKAVFTGLPVRKDFGTMCRDEAKAFLGLDKTRKLLLVTGGSQGAKKINEVVMANWEKLIASGFQIVHIVGAKSLDEVEGKAKELGLSDNENLKIFPFVYDMDKYLSSADLVISRSGASFMAELMTVGRPAILIPFPNSAGNHQVANARSLEKAGGAKVILEENLNSEILLNEINKLVLNENTLVEMEKCGAKQGMKDARANILSQVKSLLEK